MRPRQLCAQPGGFVPYPLYKDGCVIFVKLCQMDSVDQDFIRIDTSGGEGWQPGPVEGLSVRPLHQFGSERVGLSRWHPGTQYHSHGHPDGEEILVLDGTLEDEHGVYPTGTWLRMPPGSQHAPFSDQGCTIYYKIGHLGKGTGTASA